MTVRSSRIYLVGGIWRSKILQNLRPTSRVCPPSYRLKLSAPAYELQVISQATALEGHSFILFWCIVR